MNGLFISWTRQNGRTADLAAALGIEPRFVHLPSCLGLPGRYLRQLIATRRMLRRERPDCVVLMLPPAPALLALAAPRRGRRPRLVVDLHTGFFLDPKWRWACRASLRRIRRLGAIAVVTNEPLRQICSRARVESVVLHDVLVEGGSGADRHEAEAGPGSGSPLAATAAAAPAARPSLLCPLSYANDEPVAELLGAATITPELRWVFTGRAPQEARRAAPANVEFTGFIDDAAYDALLRRSTGIVALTTREHTMQRAGYEAFNAGVPQLTSDLPELREFYGDSARYASADAERIAAAARELVADRAELRRRLLALRPRRVTEQQRALALLRSTLGEHREGKVDPCDSP